MDEDDEEGTCEWLTLPPGRNIDWIDRGLRSSDWDGPEDKEPSFKEPTDPLMEGRVNNDASALSIALLSVGGDVKESEEGKRGCSEKRKWDGASC